MDVGIFFFAILENWRAWKNRKHSTQEYVDSHIYS
jgi:hypothetical protein